METDQRFGSEHHMIKKAVILAVVLVGLLGAASYFSPHWTLYRMRSAVEARDYKAFASHVDFPALRNSFREQMTGPRGGEQAGQDNGSALEPLTRAIVGGLAGPLIDALVTPAGVIEMLGAGKPGVSQAVIASTVTQVPNTTALPDMKLSYRGRDSVAFRGEGLPEKSGSFMLRRQGWWNWKLAAVELGTAS